MYHRFFGFRESPFSVAPDSRFYYSNPVYDEAYANLLYGIRERKGFVLLTGEIGTGKTTVLRRAMEDLRAKTPFVFLFNTNLNFDDMLAYICDELGIPSKGNGRLRRLQALNDFLLEQLRQGRTTALLIDEAQDLRDSVLEDIRLISNLEGSGKKLLQIVLVGQPELEEKLAQPSLRQLRQRIAIRSRLERLKPREVREFIVHRLRSVGCKTEDLFTQEAIALIARYSRGVPRLVNVICDNALLISYAASERRVTSEVITEVARDLRLGVEEAAQPQGISVGLDSAFKDVEETAARIAANGESAWDAPRIWGGSGAWVGSSAWLGLSAWRVPSARDVAYAVIGFLLVMLGGAVVFYWSQGVNAAVPPWLAEVPERASSIAASSVEETLSEVPKAVEQVASTVSALIPELPDAPRPASEAEPAPESVPTERSDPGRIAARAAEPPAIVAPPEPKVSRSKARATKRARARRAKSQPPVTIAVEPTPASEPAPKRSFFPRIVEAFMPESHPDPQKAKRRRGVLGECLDTEPDRSCLNYNFNRGSRDAWSAGSGDHRAASPWGEERI